VDAFNGVDSKKKKAYPQVDTVTAYYLDIKPKRVLLRRGKLKTIFFTN